MAPKTPRTPQTPSSKTAVKVDWKQCSSCKATYVLRDSLRHEAVCSAIAAQDLSIADTNHGFVLNKAFYAVFDDNGCKDCLQLAVKLQRAQMMLVPPSVMQLTGIQIGSHVLVETHDDRLSTFTAWPCSHISPSSMYIDTDVAKVLQINQDKSIRVTAVNNGVHVATHVELAVISQESLPPTGKLEQMIMSQFEGHVICKGAVLVGKHIGKKLLISVDGVKRKEPKDDDVQLSEGMCCLTMGSTGTARSYYMILNNTRISLITQGETSFQQADSLELEDFGGSRDAVDEIKKLCKSIFEQETPAKNRCPRGVLLYGPPGTGKSLLVRATAANCKVALVTIQGPELFSKYYGETEMRLREKFAEAIKNDKCIVFIDEIDAVCPKRDSTSSSHSDQERRVVATLLSMLDSIPSNSRVVVMGVTNRPDALDAAIRRPGRLDREIEIKAPTVSERKEILQALLRKIPNRLETKDIEHLASVTHGFVGADLSLVCAEASLAAAKRVASSATHDEPEVLPQDAKGALNLVKPSAMREVYVEVPNVRWTDVGGQDELKRKLEQAVQWPLQHAEAFTRLGVEPPRGLLMFGPPGCSKTMIAKALATESKLNFIAVKGPELFSKWVGESERAVREVFRRARLAAPSIIFLDELDALGSARGAGSSSSGVGDRVLAQLLTEMDGIEALKGVTVVAATNRPDMIDKALLRPGRLDRIVYVPLPDEKTRREILRIKFRKMPIDPATSLDWLVSATQGYSGAEVTAVCNEAALRALEEDMGIEQISKRHFEVALELVKPRITAETIQFYENYVKESGMHTV